MTLNSNFNFFIVDMSSKKSQRKVNTPGGGLKNIRKTPNIKQPLLQLLPNLSNDSDMSCLNTTLAPEVIAIDWNLHCDLAYNDYLCAIMRKHLTREKIEENNYALDDQLAQEAKYLRRLIMEKDKVLHEIDNIKMRMAVKKLSTKLRQAFTDLNEILWTYNVSNNFNKYIDYLEDITNRVYLYNIKPFDTQADYDQFALLIQKFSTSIQKLQNIIDNDTVTDEMGQQLEKFIQLKDQLVTKQKLLCDVLLETSLLLFQNMSDKLDTVDIVNL
ncbi:hypothetical protein FQA39_LY18947 [Lamprigera yunnana]|nr:hypothetical protein FQA39_LY18947 [Lamprigera yunnana]